MKLIKDVPFKQTYWKSIEDELNRVLYEVIYAPLLAVFKENTEAEIKLENAKEDPLTAAIRSGKIWYEDGAFHGEFDSKITKRLREMKARYRARKKEWAIPKASLPPEVSAAFAVASVNATALRKSMLDVLDLANIGSIDKVSRLATRYSRTIKWIGDDWQKAVKAIAVTPLTDDEIGILTADYTERMDRYIKKWTEEETLKLRQKIADSVGVRAENMAKYIEQSFSVSRNKAKFLARQETSLLMSDMKIQRGKDIGAKGYIWRGSLDSRERPDHRALEGKFITWDSPPVVDRATGRRAHAGQDFNCRCQMVIAYDEK